MPVDIKPKRLSSLQNQHQILGARLHLREGWSVPEVYTTPEEETAALRESVGLADTSAQGKLMLKGTKADGIIIASLGTIPTKRGDVIEVRSSKLLVTKLAPDEFLILTPPGSENDLEASLEAEIISQDAFVSVIDQTSGLVGLLIAGPMSVGVMQKLCALSFTPSEFPNLHVAQSGFAKVRTTIVRHDQGNLPIFELYADCSYAEYLWDAILDAGMEYGIQPVGWKASIQIP